MQHIVSMTGFANDPREQEYKEMIDRLGMRLASTLAEKTTVLIVKEVTTEKYKIAKYYEKTMSCVTIEWLSECDRTNSVVEVEEFRVKKIFYGVVIHLIGLLKHVTANIKHKIQENGGIVHELGEDGIKQALMKQEIKLLMASEQAYQQLKHHHVSDAMIPIVGVQWLSASLRQQSCKFPYDYAMNQYQLGRKETIMHYKKMRNKLETALAIVKPDEISNILEHSLISIAKNVQHKTAKLLQQLIVLHGGFYLEEINPIVTHILIEPVQNIEYYSFIAHGSMTKILRVQWLLDSIYLNTKMPQEDYLIRSFKKRTGNSDQIDEKSVASSSLASKTANSITTLAQNTKRSISKVPKTVHKPTYNPNKQKCAPISNLFQGKFFYIQSSQRTEEQLRFLFSQISKHSGKIFSSRREIKCDFCFYVLNDAQNCVNLIETLKSQNKDTQIQPVSFRWVRECIAKTEFLDIMKFKSFIYKPFPFKLPIHGFYRHVFDVVGMDPVSKSRVVELYNIFGSNKVLANKSQITHCLCGEGFMQSPRFHEIRQENPNVVFLDWKWLIECANTGKIADYDNFLVFEPQAINE